jgi:hypothetical protein
MTIRITLALLTAACILTGLTACLKTVANNNTKNPAGVTYVNMAIAAPDFTVSLDNVNIGDTILFPYANYKMKSSTDSSMYYYSTYAGIHSVAFTDSSTNILVSGNTQFSTNTNYSVYLYDTLSSQGLNAVQLQDSFDSVPSNYSLIRFLNFSPNSTQYGYDLVYNEDTAVLYYAQAFVGNATASTATLSAYLQILPGNYEFALSEHGAVPAVYDDSILMRVVAGKAYTLFVTGLVDSTGSKALTLGVIHMN